jgi:hypothetical protein
MAAVATSRRDWLPLGASLSDSSETSLHRDDH